MCNYIVYKDVKKRVIVVTPLGKELIDRYIRVCSCLPQTQDIMTKVIHNTTSSRLVVITLVTLPSLH